MAKKGVKDTAPPSKVLPKVKNKRLPIVGIGASAGGLEAFESFFKAMPAETGMAFVLVSHLDPNHVSILPELIKRHTKMKVLQIRDGQAVEADHVYVIPPNKDLNILNDSLYLLDLPLSRGLNLPINSFFRSLALDQGANSIGIILSGTGTDGTLGIKAIKGELGMVMVQEEASAKYGGMPKSAIETGLTDYILAVEKMPEQLIAYTRRAILQPKPIIRTKAGNYKKALSKIFILLRSRTGHDFSLYKENTIFRRIERRLHVHQVDNIEDYVTFLQKNETEAHVLFKDLLIGVTSFFRDKEAFEKLKTVFLTRLLKNKPENYKIRIWTAACSSGEEAYSIAILVQECMDILGVHFDVQIFGTDIDEDAINLARTGLYSLSISADVTEDRLRRYFTREETHYRIKTSIREMLVFAPHSLIKDPPFTRLDLISCRNLLIYLGPELQKKLFPVFHYSLKQDGTLFLGSSESLGPAADLFKTEDQKWKIFTALPSSLDEHPLTGVQISASDEGNKKPHFPTGPAVQTLSSEFGLLKSILEQSDTPPCVVINRQNNIVYVHGRTGNYLEPAIGKASLNVLEMARPGLKAVLAASIRKISMDKQARVLKDIDIQKEGGLATADVIIKPLQGDATQKGLMMIIFNDSPKKAEKRKPGRPKKNTVLAKVEQELQYTRENLQSTIEELETSNEELKSTNEELQSTNEELQSTNEELETSKEELQSLNEESATVNAELQSRIEEITLANNDMKNLLESTQIATIFLDFDLCVKRFTKMATALIPLSSTDIGRPLSHFATQLIDVNLVEHAKKVFKDLVIRELEAQTLDAKSFRIRFLPYRTTQNVIDGVVITFEDITKAKKDEQHLRRLAAVVTDSNDAVSLCDFSGRIMAWNRGARVMYGYSEKEALKLNIRDLISAEQEQEKSLLIHRLKNGEVIKPFKTRRKSKDGRMIDIWLTATLLKDPSGHPEGIATTERAIDPSAKEDPFKK